MAQISETLYNTIADAYASIYNSLDGVSTEAQTALYAIVNVDTADYPNVSQADPAAALEIELALLQPFNTAYSGSVNIQNSTSSLHNAIIAINNYVINNTSGTDTAVVKLQTWINTSMLGSWTATNCPAGWASICESAGYDVSGWDTE